ncbi:alanine racemase [Herbidospora mongoliensis]|uniref:alanine racemase n=1 Tax=Herbidospora mongoliensis TaxID=688067 RepID=UPI000836EC66|nr:alanine racemase [Herbidospora mongoliensis]
MSSSFVTPAEARVDLSAIRHNAALLKEVAGGAELMAAVKADAYGHGLVPCAEAALEGGASSLGVATIREAMALRDGGVIAPVLAWLIPPGEPIDEAVARHIDLSAGAPWLVEEIAASARRTGKTVNVHLKVDTGISRGGASAADWPELVEAALKAQAEGLIVIDGVWSHFASADIPGDPSIEAQLRAFDEASDLAKRAGITARRHIANSAAIVTLPQARYDLVRPGIALYGLSPIPHMGDFGLRPAMTLTAKLALVKKVPKGTGVSYGHLYTTKSDTTLGLIPLGYADGIMRNATNRAQVLVNDRRFTVAGRVCMDQFTIDLGDHPATEGDEVVLFGPGDRNEPTCQEWADSLGTITHEIVTRIGARVPRVHVRQGERE